MSVVVEHGYRVLPQILPAAEIQALRGAIEDAINRVARVMLTPFEESHPGAPIETRLELVARRDRAYASALLQVVMADAQRDARIAGLATHAALATSIHALVAPATPTGYVVRTRAAMPAFTSQISPWHQDVIRPQEDTGCASVRLAAWVPLADVDHAGGALEVIRGAWEAPCRHEQRDGHFSIPEAALPSGDRHVVAMRVGDVLLLDRYVPHRALPTHGSQGRWSVVMWVKAAGARCAC
jgi:ectoine hydroxylase-related dioxygenase (phytanoyl-CoA dioxygenase family)